jgi:hypothetical protein
MAVKFGDARIDPRLKGLIPKGDEDREQGFKGH